MRNKAFILFLSSLSVASLGAGYFWNGGVKSTLSGRSLANTPEQKSMNHFDNLPCATPEEFERYSKIIHLKEKPEGSLCGDGSHAEKLGKILRFLDEIKFTRSFPDKDGFKAAAHGLEFVGERIASIQDGLEPERMAQKKVIGAYNRENHVWLGDTFYESPFSAAADLLHEAFHSDQKDKSHEVCRRGYLANVKIGSGGCDRRYDDAGWPGAYTITTQVLLSLGFGEGFSIADRKNAISMAAGRLDLSFNYLGIENPVYESLVTLDSKGSLRPLHPLALRLMSPVVLTQTLKEGDQLIRMRDTLRFGLCAFSSQGEVRCSRSQFRFFRQFAGVGVKDLMGSMDSDYVPYLIGITLDNRIKYRDGNTWEIKDSAYQTQEPLSQLASAFGERFALLSDGTLKMFKSDSNAFATSQSIVDFDEPSTRWGSVVGGVFGSDLYLIDSKHGRLYFASGVDTLVQQSIMQCDQGMDQYADGLNSRAALCKDGKLAFRSYEDWNIKAASWEPADEGAKVVSVGFVSGFSTGELGRPTDPDEEFTRACDLRWQAYDEWTGGRMGIDRKGRLVVTGPGETECLIAKNPKLDRPIRSLTVAATQGIGDRYIPILQIDVKFEDGTSTRLRPYGF